METMKELLLENPIIAAVKDDPGLAAAMDSDCRVVFLLYGTVLNLPLLTDRVRAAGKLPLVHIDLIEGLSNREIAVDLLLKLCRPAGLISTRVPQLRRGKALGLLTVQRGFLLDSMSVKSLEAQIEAARPDFVEVLPGILPRVIGTLRKKTEIPIIAGGLIQYKQDVIEAIGAGAVAVSTSCQSVWDM